ncbi:MAG TPA: tetratricopeptide repeat protein [Tepidisphaeraceae bacterium]|nr:tetratricopeptide repeat protein [Tepidisphaeraceae bacterium]
MTQLKSPDNARQLAWIAPLAALAVFVRIIGFDFLNWDDHETIFQNTSLLPVTIQSFIDAWAKPHLSLWIPITHTLWAMLAWIGGSEVEISPTPFRLMSLALHATTVWLVLDLLFRLLHSNRAALGGALLFAIHPIQVESVAWISGQKDLLAGLFMIASARAFVMWREKLSPKYFVLTLALGLCAMLSKPAAVTTPLIWLVIALMGRIDRATIRLVMCGLLIALPIVFIAREVQPASSIRPVAQIDRIPVAGDALVFYFKQFVWPWPLVADYARTPQSIAHDSLNWLKWIVPAALISLAFAVRKRIPELLGGLLIVIACVVPVLGFLPFEFQKYSTVSDHYLYAAMLGPALIVAMIVARQRKAFGNVVALLAIASIFSFLQTSHWRDTQSLFAHNLQHVPQSLAANRTLAYLASQREDVERAEELYRAASTFRPDDELTAFNLANLLARQQRLDESIEFYDRAIQIQPNRPTFRYNRAIVLMQLGRLDEAMIDTRQLLKIEPSNENAKRLQSRLEELIANPTTQATTKPE